MATVPPAGTPAERALAAALERLARAERAYAVALQERQAALAFERSAQAGLLAERAAAAAELAASIVATPGGPAMRYRVTKGGWFASNGVMAMIKAGHVVTTAAYSRRDIDTMLGRGIVLEPF